MRSRTHKLASVAFSLLCVTAVVGAFVSFGGGLSPIQEASAQESHDKLIIGLNYGGGAVYNNSSGTVEYLPGPGAGQVAYGDGFVYLEQRSYFSDSGNEELQKVNPRTKETIWSKEIPASFQKVGVGPKGNVYVTKNNGYFVKFNSTGSEIGNVSVPNGNFMEFSSSGIAYVASGPGIVSIDTETMTNQSVLPGTSQVRTLHLMDSNTILFMNSTNGIFRYSLDTNTITDSASIGYHLREITSQSNQIYLGDATSDKGLSYDRIYRLDEDLNVLNNQTMPSAPDGDDEIQQLVASDSSLYMLTQTYGSSDDAAVHRYSLDLSSNTLAHNFHNTTHDSKGVDMALMVNSSQPSSGNTVTGRVTTQSGTPVANATVEIVGAKQPSIAQARNTLSSLSDPIPTEFVTQLDSGFDAMQSFEGTDAKYVAIYEPSGGYNVPLLDSADLRQPLWVNVPAYQPVTVIVGDASQNDGGFWATGEYERQVPGTIIEHTAVFERLSPTGEVVERMNVTTNETFGGGFLDGSQLRYAQVKLTPGIYRVQAQGSAFHYYIKVGNPIPDFDEALKTIQGQITDYSQSLREAAESGTIVRKVVVTNETGHFSASVPNSVKLVTVTARKSPALLKQGVDPENVTQELIRDTYSVRESITDPQERLQAIPNESIYIPSVPVTARPPADDVHLTMVEVGFPSAGDLGAYQEKYRALLNALLNGSMSDLPPALQQAFEELTREETEELHEEMSELKERNDRLRERFEEIYESRFGQPPTEIIINDTSDEELRNRISALQQALTELQSTIEAGEGVVERGVNTITYRQPFGVPLSPEDVLVRAHYSNGTSVVVPDEYVSIDNELTNAFGAGGSEVVVDEYPIPENIGSVRFSVDVANAEGIGHAGAVVTNPAFDGEVPTIAGVSVSSLEPGTGETVSLNIVPGEESTYRSVTGATVYGPSGQTLSTTIKPDGTVQFQTANTAGRHIVRVQFEDINGHSYVLPIRLKASENINRPPGVRLSETPFGTVAIVGDGLEAGSVDVSADAVEITAQIEAGSDAPPVLHVYESGATVPADATRTIRVVRGEEQASINKKVGIVLHTAALTENAIVERGEDQPITRSGETRYGVIQSTSGGTTIRTFTQADGSVEVHVNNDPSSLERLFYWLDVQTASLTDGLPFLSLTPPTLPAAPTASTTATTAPTAGIGALA